MEGIDQSITLWLNSIHAPWSDAFWCFMSLKTVWIPLYVLLAAMLVWRLGWKRGLLAVAGLGVAFFFDESINNIVKELVQRPRPCNDMDMLAAGIRVLEDGGGWSFPSGHACNCFGLGVGAVLYLLRWPRCFDIAPVKGVPDSIWKAFGVIMIVWGALVGISRIMVAKHFFFDVMAGFAEGALIAWICWRFFSLIAKKLD